MLATGALLVTMPLPAAAYRCAISRADKAWLDAAIENWRSNERHILKLASAALPTIFAIDAGCTLYLATRDYGLPDTISDDSLQEAFKANINDIADYEAERDLLCAAATAPTDDKAQIFAGKALKKMRQRRIRFTGAGAQWLPLDDLFLIMEELGQPLLAKRCGRRPLAERSWGAVVANELVFRCQDRWLWLRPRCGLTRGVPARSPIRGCAR